MEREKHRDRALGLLDAWAGIGVLGRLVVTIAVIAPLVWLATRLTGS